MGKLDSFKSRQPLREIRVPDFPNAGQLFKEHGPISGAAKLTEGLVQWKQSLERMLREMMPETPAATVVETPVETEAAPDTTLAALTAHAASLAAHGADGAVVGTENEQNLDSKNIGLTRPGYGRFSPLIGRSSIGVNESVTIAAGDYMIVPEEFTIEGTLVVDGIFAVV